MSLSFQNVFAVLATFECLSIWKFDECSGRSLVITPEIPKGGLPLPKPKPPVDEIKGDEINASNLLRILWQITKNMVWHWFVCVLPKTIKRFCRLSFVFCMRIVIWLYDLLTLVLKWTVVITLPALSLSYLMQLGCVDDHFMYSTWVAWFIIVKVALLLICKLILAQLILKFAEVSGGKGTQREDSAITK